MSYQQTLNDLFGLQQFGIKLGLDNIRALLERRAHPHAAYPIIHVAGTNGKGSVCAALESILRRAGLRVGLYTSPHLHDFTERIQVGAVPIAEAEVVRLAQTLRLDAADLPITFFELTTAMALEYFREQAVDVAVVEVGMGGRLDATNVVNPVVSVITPVSHDDGEHLGADLESIAREKGGIIKPGVPVVIGPQAPQALAALHQLAQRAQAQTFVYGRDFRVQDNPQGFDFLGCEMRLSQLRPRLCGRHQHDNLAVALAVIEVLRAQGWSLEPELARQGVEQACWPGRLEWIHGSPPVLLDGAHNIAGAEALRDYLAARQLPAMPWLVGLSGRRTPADILSPWLPWMGTAYVVAPAIDKAVAVEQVAAYLRQQGIAVRCCASGLAAWESASREHPAAAALVVAGSLYLVGEVRNGLLTRTREAM